MSHHPGHYAFGNDYVGEFVVVFIRSWGVGIRSTPFYLLRCTVLVSGTIGPHTWLQLVPLGSDRFKGLRAFGYITKKEVYYGLSYCNIAPDMARALIQSGWLPQFRVFNEL